MNSSKDNNKKSGLDSRQRDTGSGTRRYHSPLRKQQLEETRQRIVMAGVELIGELAGWDWKSVTFREVAKRAGISERTVYRHFASERALKDAIMQQLVESSGIDLSTLQLSDFAEATSTAYEFLARLSSSSAEDEDPTFSAIDEQRRAALIAAVARATPQWSTTEQENIAALLDILWNVPPYERLAGTWRFDNARITQVVSWLIHLIEDAVAEDKRPG